MTELAAIPTQSHLPVIGCPRCRYGRAGAPSWGASAAGQADPEGRSGSEPSPEQSGHREPDAGQGDGEKAKRQSPNYRGNRVTARSAGHHSNRGDQGDDGDSNVAGLPPCAVARAMAFAIEQPPDLDVSEVAVRPTA